MLSVPPVVDAAAAAAVATYSIVTEHAGTIDLVPSSYRYLHYADMTSEAITARRALWNACGKNFGAYVRHGSLSPIRDVDVIAAKIGNDNTIKIVWGTTAFMSDNELCNRRSIKCFTPRMVSQIVAVQKNVVDSGVARVMSHGLFDGVMLLPTGMTQAMLEEAYTSGATMGRHTSVAKASERLRAILPDCLIDATIPPPPPHANLSQPANPFFNNVLHGIPNDIRATRRPQTMSIDDADRYAFNLALDAVTDALGRCAVYYNDTHAQATASGAGREQAPTSCTSSGDNGRSGGCCCCCCTRR